MPVTRASSFTDQVGIKTSPASGSFPTSRIETDSYPNIIDDNGSAVSATQGSMLYCGRVGRASTGGDMGLMGNRSDTSINWSMHMQSKDSDGPNQNALQFYTRDVSAEYTAITASGFIPAAGANMIIIGTARQDDDVRIWAKKPGQIITADNFGVCQMHAATTDVALNTYHDLSATRTVNGASFQGGWALACVWNRQLAESEVLSLLADPWQIFEPRTVWIPFEIAGPITASGTPSIPSIAASGAATVHRAASGAAILTAIIAAGVATVVHTASDGAPSLAPIESTGTAQIIKTASGSPSVPVITASGAATVHRAASGAATLSAVEAAGSAVHHKSASDGAPAIAPVEASGVAVIRRTASGNPAVPAITSSGSATVHKEASDGAPTIPAIEAAGTANVAGNVTSSGAAILTPVESSGTVDLTRNANGNPSLTAITASGAATVRHVSSGAATLTPVEASGAAIIINVASGSATLASIEAAGVGVVVRTAAGSSIIPSLTASGVAIVGGAIIVASVDLDSLQMSITLESADHSSLNMESREIDQFLEGTK